MAEAKDALPAAQPQAVALPDDEVLYELADLFRVFGDSTRIKILYALHDNELCVQDIANAVQLSQSAVSHQLR
ncbi:MAG: winged helix-turn-helix transcriptional regulator, partial [Faecalibacterium sp.]|nr:winged helix-turn-helix transcriptional regulator [Faecalibacterium sp.]